MFNRIRHLDFMSPKPSLLVDRRSRFKNIYGGLLTIFSFLTILVFSIILLIKLLNRENMSIIYNEEFIENPYLNFTKFPIFFEVYNANGNKFEKASRLFSIKSKKYLIQDVTKDGIVKKDIKVSMLNITECSVLMKNPNSYYNQGEMLKTDIKDKLCLDLSDNYFLRGSSGDQGNQSFIAIDVDKCTNTSLKNDCYPSEYIDSVLGRPHFIIRFKNNYINNNNINNPEISYIKSEMITFNSQMMKIITYQFNPIEYNTDFGYIFSDNKQLNFFKQSEANVDSFGLAPGNYAMLKFQFTMSKTKGVYYRNFEKFHTVMASVSAVTRLIIFVVGMLDNIFNEYYFYNYICNYINIYEHSDLSNWDYSNNLNKNLTTKKKVNKINSLFAAQNNKKINDNNPPMNIENNIVPRKNLNPHSSKKNWEQFKDIAINNSNVINLKRDIESCNFNIHNSQLALNEMKKEKGNLLNVNKSVNLNNNFSSNNNNVLELRRRSAYLTHKNTNVFNLNDKLNKNVDAKNYFSFATNFKKKYKLDISCADISRNISYFFKNQKTLTMDLGISYIKKKVSIEEMIRKMLEIDKLKFFILNREQINSFNSLTGPNPFSDIDENQGINKIKKKKKLCKKNSDIFRYNVDELWSNYEF